MKLLIAVPALDYIHSDFVKQLLEIDKIDIPHETLLVTGTLVYLAREKIASKAINDGFTHVLWIDADMVFRPDMLNDLLDVGKDVVTGRFISRRPPFVACQFSDLPRVERVREYPLQPFRIDGTGLAFTVTTADILKRVMVHYGTCFNPEPGFGEDLAFCKRVKEMGGEIWCEPTVQVGHIAHVPVYPGDDYDYLRRAGKC